MNKNTVLLWSLVVALGGFLFGYGAAVISGAEPAIERCWKLTPAEHGLSVPSAIIGTVAGSLVGSNPSDLLGRRATLIIIAVFFFVASIETACAFNWYVFVFFLFLGGLAVGTSSVTIPVYITEIAPTHKRGQLVALFQFNIVFGILFSYFSNYLIGPEGEAAWRWMLGVQALPSFLFFVLLQLVPESPRWLILNKGKDEEAMATLEIINPNNYTKDAQTIKKNLKGETVEDVKLFLFRRYKLPIFLAVSLAVFNQVSGINAMMYYAPRIFKITGLGRSASLLSTVGIGAVYFIFKLLAINFIDRVGRKTLMIIGSIGMITTLGLIAQAFYTQNLSGWSVTIYFLEYIAFFVLSHGVVIWVFISEIFPNRVRAKGQILGSTTLWVMAAIITFSFPMLDEEIGVGHTFMFFCIMMVFQLLFVWKLMPETKGRSLEQIERTLVLH